MFRKSPFPKSAIATILLCCVCACAHTTVVSEIDWEAEPRAFEVVAVSFESGDPELKAMGEYWMRIQLNEYGLQSYSYRKLFPRGMSLSDSDRVRIFDSLGIQAIWTIRPRDAGTTSTYIPGQTQTDINGTITEDYFGDIKVKGKAITRTTPGMSVVSPWATYTGALYDRASAKWIWRAKATTEGNHLASEDTMLNSVACQMVEKMRRDGFLPWKPIKRGDGD